VDNLDDLELLSKDELIELLKEKADAGVKLSFPGKALSRRIARRVRPRVQKTVKKYGAGSNEERAENLLVEGDNLQALVTLYKERGRVDLILTDPPYNTGGDWRYNDKWDDDPNDSGVGELVSADDRARHTKWMKFMYPRLQMMKQMLKLGGVLAICIDHRELFHLGQMLDEIFGEQNRIAIINWEKTTAPKSANSHVSTSTEYVLVYARDIEYVNTERGQREDSSNNRYSNPDNDPRGDWREGNLTAPEKRKLTSYGIQSPFTGVVHYPAGNGHWRRAKSDVHEWLEAWGSKYEERSINDDRAPALMVRGCEPGKVPPATVKAARKVLAAGRWPFVWFGRDGEGRPRVKTHLKDVLRGAIPVTYWADDDLEPLNIGSTSWGHENSGRSSDGVAELTAIVGTGHGYETVKPLKLFQKLIQLWCPSDGTVMDPFAGSGTSGRNLST
jgi:adenine-specific DNA-methyltransferase